MSDFALEEDQQAAITARRDELARLTARQTACQEEFGTLEAELMRFEHLYNETVGIRLARLDELEAEIAEHAAALQPKDAGMSQHAAETRAKATASAQSLGREAEHGTGASNRLGKPPRHTQRGTEPKPEAPGEKGEGVALPTLKSLWRQIAKYLHPDRAFDQDDEPLMQELMVEANLAYERGDRESLEVLLKDGRLLDTDGPGALQLLHLSMAIDRVRRQIERLEAQIAVVREQDTWRLKARVDDARKTGTDLLARMARQVDEQIIAAQQRLAAMAGNWRRTRCDGSSRWRCDRPGVGEKPGGDTAHQHAY